MATGETKEIPADTVIAAIGERIAEIVAGILSPAERNGRITTRKAVTRGYELSMEERNALIVQDPSYGSIVCRCEMVSEGEIREAIRKVPGARSLDGVKRRTRAGMGRCQSGFCEPRTMKILEEMLEEYTANDITKHGRGSEILVREEA